MTRFGQDDELLRSSRRNEPFPKETEDCQQREESENPCPTFLRGGTCLSCEKRVGNFEDEQLNQFMADLDQVNSLLGCWLTNKFLNIQLDGDWMEGLMLQKIMKSITLMTYTWGELLEAKEDLLTDEMRRLRHSIPGLDDYLELDRCWSLEEKVRLLEEEVTRAKEDAAMTEEQREMRSEVQELFVEKVQWMGKKRRLE